MSNFTTSSPDYYDYGDEIPLHFMLVNYEFAIILMVGLGIAGAIGTFGNLLILLAVATRKELHSVDSVFVVNLACCDLYVTMFAEPLSILSKVVGWKFFEGVPGLCRTIGVFCTISCVGSLMTLSAMSCNRYVLIVHHAHYRRIFTLRNCLLACVGIYLLGFFLTALNFFGVGDHSFDMKSYECVWDRMASHDYTIVFSIVLVWIPICVVGFTYSRMYAFVKNARRNLNKHPKVSASNGNTLQLPGRLQLAEVSSVSSTRVATENDFVKVSPLDAQDGTEENEKVPQRNSEAGDSGFVGESGAAAPRVSFSPTLDKKEPKPTNPRRSRRPGVILPELKLARPLFIIYVVFCTCWMPYSIIIIIDRYDKFSPELHAFITAFAHLNSSINWLVYYQTHSKLRRAFRGLLGLAKLRANKINPSDLPTTTAVRPRVSYQ